ncbi:MULTISPECIES: LexA family transcriptional regulator [Aeromonas]|uniref:LexA family transcriptional regulator n=1 Tax=Aeromonas TaxID=642 RepID=UPI000CDD87CC|nr:MULTISPECIES: S24 family peptidase [Aeromonas]AUZ77091.1 hypothetical protein C2U40_21170 [Aeromonas sp. ASNIH4]POU39369.1 hypothetical protein C3405_09755 [Aeromonas hydrophila]POV88929.1 hypothetical protein C3395_09760 [Aeromonas sp. ASNIH6]
MQPEHKSDQKTLHSGSEEWNVSDRIKEVIGKRSIRQAASDWGLPFATVNNWLKGAMPALDTIAEISKKEGVSLEWIAYGKGASTTQTQTQCASEPEQPYNANDMDHLAKVPTFNVEASAGAGAWINAENICDYWYVPRTWLRLERLEHAELCIINTVGDSMAPHINNGDRLLVKTNIDRELALNGVYVINLDGHLRVKRLEFTLSPIGYRVISDNELYPPEFVPAAELTQRLYVIGEVVRVFGQPAKPTPPIQ